MKSLFRLVPLWSNVLICIHFWRQHFILFSIVIGDIGAGCLMAFPSALSPSILATNGTDIRATAAEASWIVSSASLSAIPAFIILPLLMQRFGRRLLNIISNFFLVCGWIMFWLATDISSLFIARILHGVSVGCFILNLVLVAEYANPNRRGYFVVLKKLFVAVGASLCHLLILFCSWRRISAITCIFNFMSMTMTLFWPETPAFLVTRNRFEECKKSFVWLHGNESNKKELVDLIASQEDRLKEEHNRNFAKYTFKRILQTDSLKAFFITVLIVILVEASGKHYFAAYLVQIMTELLGDKSLAVYATLGGDITTMIGLFTSAIIVKYFKRRTLLFGFGYLSISLLVCISVCLYLKSSYPSACLNWLTVGLILTYALVANIGMIPVTFIVKSEVFPLDLRGIGVAMSGLAFAIFFGAYLKLIPYLISYTGLFGTYFINACIAGVCLIILHFILPETKDRILLDIENEMKGKNKSYVESKPMLNK